MSFLIFRNEKFGTLAFNKDSNELFFTDKTNIEAPCESCIKYVNNQILKDAWFSAPLWVTIEITYACNLKCKHCHIGYKKDIFIELSIYKKIIDDLSDHGIFQVVISGGEPTLHPEFTEICNYAHKKGLYVKILSNGTKINSDMISKTLIDEISISLHSDDPLVHDEFVGVDGSFDETVNSIALCKYKHIKTKIRSNIDAPNKFKNYVHKITVAPIFQKGDAEKNFDGFKDVSRCLKNFVSLNDFIFIGCPGGRATVLIDPYGNVYPCPYMKSVRSRYTNSFENWRNDINKKMTNFILNHSYQCSQCNIFNLKCGGICGIRQVQNCINQAFYFECLFE